MKLVLPALLVLSLFGCSKTKDDMGGSEMTEPAQQLGDLVASIDEAGGATGVIALEKSARRTFARLAPQELDANLVTKVLLPQAEAVSCSSTANNFNGGFSMSCTGSAGAGFTRVRNFQGCTVGSAQDVVFNGSVSFKWETNGATAVNGCSLASTGNTITRVPSFTVEGRRGATLTVSKSGSYGQKMTWISGAASSRVFNLTSDGIERKFASPGGVVTFDYITTVSSLTINGDNRYGRSITGGSVVVKDNLTQVTCTYSPVNVTWTDASCNCPTQGTWQGTCSDNKAVTLVLSGCGTGNLTFGSETGVVTFDRCGN